MALFTCAIVLDMPKSIQEILKDVRVGDLPLQTDHRIAPETPLRTVYEAFDAQRHGAAMIVEGDRVTGIFTQRDVLYRTAIEGIDLETPVAEVMSTRPVTVGLDAPLSRALEVMVDGGYRHVPVVDRDGHSVGLLSSRVILKFIADHYPETVLNLPPRLDQAPKRPEGG